MAFQLSPGVNVSEIDLTTIVPAVGTTEGAFAGKFVWGPANAVVTINNEDELVRTFGKPSAETFRSFFTAANFLSYARSLRTVRAINSSARNAGALKPALIRNRDEYEINYLGLPPASNAFGMFAARYPGVIGNSLKVSLFAQSGNSNAYVAWGATENAPFYEQFDGVPGTSDYVARNGGSNDEMHIIVIDEDGRFTGVANSVLERFAYVSKAIDATNDDGSSNYYVNVINERSRYIYIMNHAQSMTANANVTGVFISNSGSYHTPGSYSIAATGNTGTVTTQAVVDLIVNAAGYVSQATLSVAGEGYNPADTLTVNTTTLQQNNYTLNTASIIAPGTGYNVGTFFVTAFDGTAGSYANANVQVITNSSGVITDVNIITVGDLFKKGDAPSLNLKSIGAFATGSGTGNGASITFTTKFIGTNSVVNTVYDLREQTSTWGTPSNNKVFSQNSASYTASLSGGVDGLPTDADLIVAYDKFKSPEDVDISLIVTGDASQTVSEYIVDNIVENRKDCVAFISPEYSDVVNNAGNEANDIIAYRNLFNSTSYAVMDNNWKYQFDKYNNVYRWIPLNGDIAGLCVRTDFERDPWFSPAGFNRGQIKNVVKLAWNADKADRDDLYKSGINPVVTFPGEGVVLYGDKTMLAKPSAFDRINVRRLFIVLEKAIARAAKYSLFEFNDEFTRAQFVALVEPFLRDVQGRRGIYDFRVVCDTTNNTPEVIDRNEFIGDIYIKPARSINYIQLNFVAVRTGVAFEEVVGKF